MQSQSKQNAHLKHNFFSKNPTRAQMIKEANNNRLYYQKWKPNRKQFGLTPNYFEDFDDCPVTSQEEGMGPAAGDGDGRIVVIEERAGRRRPLGLQAPEP